MVIIQNMEKWSSVYRLTVSTSTVKDTAPSLPQYDLYLCALHTLGWGWNTA